MFITHFMLTLPLIGECASKLSAEDVLHRMAETYGNCKMYRDTGMVTGMSHVIRFKTAFARPNRFRFEYSTEESEFFDPTRMIIWADAGKANKWRSNRPGIETKPLEMAIAGATGVSSSSAHTVPRLLMPDKIGGRALPDLVDDIQLIGIEPSDETDCYKLMGNGRRLNQAVVKIWIGKDDYLIRKIVWVWTREDTHCTSTTLYHPRVNIDLPDSAFASGVKK